MLRTKTKRLIFASILLFLFFPSIIVFGAVPCGYSSQLRYEQEVDNCIGNRKIWSDVTCSCGTTTTNSGGSSNTAPQSNSSGGGLVQCGNEGGKACTFGDIFSTLGRAIDFVLMYIVPALATFGVVMAAITMMTSNGDPGKFKQGKDAIITIGIGLIIIYLSWTIVSSFIQFLGGQSWIFGQ